MLSYPGIQIFTQYFLFDMKAISLKLFLSVGLFLIPSVALQANPTTTLVVNLSGYFQANQSVSGNIDRSQVGIFRVNSKQLLTFMAQEKGVKFPSGAVLKVADTGDVFVEGADGKFIMDAGDFLSVTFHKYRELLSGELNLANGKEDRRKLYPITLKLKFAAIQGTLRGLATVNLDVSLPNPFGIQTSQVAINSSMFGTGGVKGGTGHITGTINLTGKSAAVR